MLQNSQNIGFVPGIPKSADSRSEATGEFMKLIDLITFFRQGGTFEGFCRAQGLDEDSEVIEIYAHEPVGLESELGFFPVEETEGQLEFQSKGLRYHNLFDFFYFLDVIEGIRDCDEPIDSELAQRLFTYAMTDA